MIGNAVAVLVASCAPTPPRLRPAFGDLDHRSRRFVSDGKAPLRSFGRTALCKTLGVTPRGGHPAHVQAGVCRVLAVHVERKKRGMFGAPV